MRAGALATWWIRAVLSSSIPYHARAGSWTEEGTSTWTAVHQWTPLAANITIVRRPEDTAVNITASWRILHVTDAHISLGEAQDLHAFGTRRMHGAFTMALDKHLEPGVKRTPAATFQKVLKLIEGVDPDVVILTGDIVNFPHNESVQFVVRELASSRGAGRIPVVFTAGNHDWHVEGLGRGVDEQRATFRREVLRPLYQLHRPNKHIRSRAQGFGDSDAEDWASLELLPRDPPWLGATHPGLLILSLDNSIYQVSQDQVEFVWRELARGIPTLLALHVPLMLPGATPGNTKTILCGDPRFGHAADSSWQVERRERWPHEGASASTKQFIQDVVQKFAAPRGPLLGIIGGHEHLHRADVVGRPVPAPSLCTSGTHNASCKSSTEGHNPPCELHEGMVQYVTPAGFEGGHRIIEIRDARH